MLKLYNLQLQTVIHV